MADRQRISYVPLDQMDEQMRAEMERCSREGTPRHHQVMPGTAASLAPGFATPDDMAATMAADGYWAKH